MENILQSGRIPLKSLVGGERIELMATEVFPEGPLIYTPISHVWSDGLGNPHENSMPLCQLQHFEKLIEKLREVPKYDGEMIQYGSIIPF